MRLVYKNSTGKQQLEVEVKVGDKVLLNGDHEFEVTYFREPHKSSSSGKVTVSNGDGSMEYYVGVIGAHWIERGNR